MHMPDAFVLWSTVICLSEVDAPYFYSNFYDRAALPKSELADRRAVPLQQFSLLFK